MQARHVAKHAFRTFRTRWQIAGERTLLPFVVYDSMVTFTRLATLPATVGQRTCDEEFEFLSGKIVPGRKVDGAAAFRGKVIRKERLKV